MKSSFDAGGCFPTGRHYPGIAHLIRVTVEGLASEFGPELDVWDIPWVAIDTETTGRSAEADRVVEVGCVFFAQGVVTGRRSWLINPGCPIPVEASNVHGILDADVAEMPRFAEILAELLQAVEGYLPLAYNAEFDRKFLIEEWKRERGDASVVQSQLPSAFRAGVAWIDPLDWARELQKEHKSRSLGDVCERLGISLENAHRATDDAEAAGQVMATFLRDSRVPRSYGAFIKEQQRLGRMFSFERNRWR